MIIFPSFGVRNTGSADRDVYCGSLAEWVLICSSTNARRHGTATKAEVTVQSRDWLGAVIYFGRSHLYPVANFLESKILKNGLIKIGL